MEAVGVNALQNVFEIGPGVNFIFTVGGGKAHEDRRGMPAGLAAHKKPVLAAQGKGSYGILRQIVINRNPSIR